jgi:SAM-dependent methyltransferase
MKQQSECKDQESPVVCWCGRVTEKTVIKAIMDGNTTLEQLRQATGVCPDDKNCAHNNPKNLCCVPDVMALVKQYASDNLAQSFVVPAVNTIERKTMTQEMQKKTDGEAVKELVRAGYAAIATGERASCCGNSSCCPTDPKSVALAVGYDAASLANLPDGANMGLSCGNPVAIAALQEGQTVLDLGSGGGFDVFQAGVKVKESGRVIGVDMTPEMLTKARNNIAQYRERTGLDNVEFRLGEIEHLPVPDISVDVVLSNCVINLSPDKDQVWREIFRVLKPGGKVSISDVALLKPLPDNIRTMVEALVGCVAGAVLVEETRAMLEKAGFTSIILTPKHDFLKSIQETDDPFYTKISQALPPGEEIADYAVSLSIEAGKPANNGYGNQL